MGCVVKGYFIEMPIKLSVDVFLNITNHQYVHFYKSGRRKYAIISAILIFGNCPTMTF